MSAGLPYFDEVFRQRALDPGSEFVQALGTRHVHWGFYSDPEQADASVAQFKVATEALTARLVQRVGLQCGESVLDVGCGFGGTSAFMNERFQRLRICGLNIDARQIAAAQAWLPAVSSNQLSFVVGDACRLPFADATFDRVLAVECIFHFPSRLRFFREARRVLRRGGRLALSDFVPWGPAVPCLAPFYLRHRSQLLRFYGSNNGDWPCFLSLYRGLALLSGFRMSFEEDITRYTLPTYPVLLRLVGELGLGEAYRAIELVQTMSERGWLRYRNLVFEAV